MWREVISVIYKWQGKDRGVTEQFSHPTPKNRLHTKSTWAGLPFWQGCEHLWHQRGVWHTHLRKQLRLQNSWSYLDSCGEKMHQSKVTTNRHGLCWCDHLCDSSTCLKCFYFLSFSVLHICNLIERITEDETCTTRNHLWAAKSWVRVQHCLMPSDLHCISSNKQGLYSKAAPCRPSWRFECSICPSTWGCSLQPPPHPCAQQLTSAHCTGSLQMESFQPVLVKQEICVVFQTNLTETRITTTLSQSVAGQNLPGTKQPCSWTLKSLPGVQCYGEHTCQGNSHSQQKCNKMQKHGKNEILYYSWEKKFCSLHWKPRRGMRDQFLQASSQSWHRPVSYG